MNKLAELTAEFVSSLIDSKLMVMKVPKVDHLDLVEAENPHTYTVSSNRKLDCAETARGYAQIFSIASLVAELIASKYICLSSNLRILSANKTLSQRDVYYSFKNIFKNQAECNSSIIELGLILQLKRHEMHLVPAAKGLVSGKMRFRFHSDHQFQIDFKQDNPPPRWIDCMEDSAADGGVIISSRWTSVPDTQTDVEIANDVKVLIVIEKEGIFHRLTEDKFFNTLPCILVTGCGFPDIATRALVGKVSRLFPTLLIVGLCDYNPSGLQLLLTYRFSSRNSIFEGQGHQAVVRWLGIRSQQVKGFVERLQSKHKRPRKEDDETSNDSGGSDNHEDVRRVTLESAFDTGLQALTKSDLKRIEALRSSTIMQSLPSTFSDELKSMILGGVKCEIEILYSMGLTYVADFVTHAIETQDYL